jgi:hypothetical protein
VAPQKPQLFLFDVRSTQVLPQGLSPEVQVMTQALSEHRGALAGHRLPQAPQLASLAVRSTQVLPQML